LDWSATTVFKIYHQNTKTKSPMKYPLWPLRPLSHPLQLSYNTFMCYGTQMKTDKLVASILAAYFHWDPFLYLIRSMVAHLHWNPTLLTSNFAWLIQLSSLHASLFKVIMMKYFSQVKCKFMNFLFALLGKIKILTLQTIYFSHQLLHMLCITPFINFCAISGLKVENIPWKMFVNILLNTKLKYLKLIL
jgi:hypothetical protein